MKIAYLYRFKAYPPKGGNRLHAYQLARRFMDAGHELLTHGDDSIAEARAFPRTPQGAADLIGEADLVYLRVDGTLLTAQPDLARVLEHTTVPTVWEVNSPANERLAFSWLGGEPVPPGAGLRRLIDQTKRATHAGRQMLQIVPEERLRRRLARRAAAAVCVSEAVGRYAREGLGMGCEVVVLPNGSDLDVNHPGREPIPLPERFDGYLKVLYAGSPIYPWQGLDTIAGAIELLRERRTPIVFLLLMNQASADITPGAHAHVLERVPYEDVARYITAADVCLTLPPDFTWSRWGFHGSPMKLFDYMACGRPVVASKVGQMSEVIRHGENGLLCDSTPEDLLAQLETLADAPERRAAMGQAARQDVLDRYNWDHIAQRTLALFDRVLSHADRTREASQHAPS